MARLAEPRAPLLVAAAQLALALALATPRVALADDGVAHAQRAFKAADYETALREFRALAKDKPAPDLLMQIARCLDRMLRSNDAIVAYQHLLHSGASSSQTKESRDRIAFLREFLARGATPDKLAAHHIERGAALFKLELFREARTEFDGAVQLLPDKPNGYRWLGLTLERVGDCKLAVSDFETFLSMVPSDDPRTDEVNAGIKRCTARGSGEATASARPVVDEPLGPKASEREKKVKQHVDRGADLYAAGRFKEAREEFAVARTLAPEKVTPFRWLGLCEAQMERCADAIQNLDVFLKRVPEGDPRVPEVKEVVAACRDRMVPARRPLESPPVAVGAGDGKTPKDATDGKGSKETPKANDPEARARALIEKGAGLYHKGSFREARDAFEAARALLPDRANAYRWLGLADARLGHCREAMASLDVFIQRVSADDDRITEVARVRGRCARELAGPPTAVATAAPVPQGQRDADVPPPRSSPSSSASPSGPSSSSSSTAVAPASPVPAGSGAATPRVSGGGDGAPRAGFASSLPSYIAPLAVGAGAVALVAIGGGVAGWGQAQYNSLAATCKPNCSTADANSVRDKLYAGYSIMALGGVAALGDAVLWYFWWKGRGKGQPAALVLPAPGGVVVTGRF